MKKFIVVPTNPLIELPYTIDVPSNSDEAYDLVKKYHQGDLSEVVNLGFFTVMVDEEGALQKTGQAQPVPNIVGTMVYMGMMEAPSPIFGTMVITDLNHSPDPTSGVDEEWAKEFIDAHALGPEALAAWMIMDQVIREEKANGN